MFGQFGNCRLARMSDGHYCFLRDLGPVKGGKGLKHHEVIVHLTLRGVVEFSRRLLVKIPEDRARSSSATEITGDSVTIR
jgi:hypothetical protein